MGNARKNHPPADQNNFINVFCCEARVFERVFARLESSFDQIRHELFEFRAVSIGDKYVDLVGVSGDLEPGDRVVTQGAYSLVAAPPASTPTAAGPR